MQIPSSLSVYGRQGTTESEQLRQPAFTSDKRRQGRESHASIEDTYSFSEEALRLARQMMTVAKASSEENTAQQASAGSRNSKAANAGLVGLTEGAGAYASDTVSSSSIGGSASISEMPSNNPETEETSEQNGGTSGGGGGGGSDSGDSVSDIQSQIAALEAKLQTVISSSAPEETKQAQSSAIQAQISELTQQLTKLQQA